MGLKYNFICPSCEYSATVEGREGHGLIQSIKTYKCEDCKSLVDIVMEDRSQMTSNVIQGIPGGVIITNDKPTCHLCNSNNVSPWSGFKPDCPKCDSKMEVGVAMTFWD